MTIREWGYAMLRDMLQHLRRSEKRKLRERVPRGATRLATNTRRSETEIGATTVTRAAARHKEGVAGVHLPAHLLGGS